MVVATYTINDERKQRITFAGPYYEAGQQIMVKSDNDDDHRSGRRSRTTPSQGLLGHRLDAVGEHQQYLASEDQLVLFDVYDKCADALGNDQVDVVTTDNVILLGFAAESEGEYKLVGEQFTEEPYGIGITKGDVEFCEFINETLADERGRLHDGVGGDGGQDRGHAGARAARAPRACS